jgi:hypothetical protein
MQTLRKHVHALTALSVVVAWTPVTGNAQETPEEDPAAVACELSRFDGAIAKERGFYRLSWSMAGNTISLQFADKDGGTVQAECPFKMANGKIVFADNVAPQVILPLTKAGIYPIDPTKTVLYFEQ